mgnify:CR=1 FL=1
MYVDVVRMLLSEIFIYPILICSIFQFVLAFIEANDNYDIKFLGITIFFSLTIISMIVVVYIFRIYILFHAFHAIQRARGEGTYRRSGTWFQWRLILHVMAQMFSQVMMIIAIAGKFYYENLVPIPGYGIRVSPYLWYMVVTAFVIPVCGFLNFTVMNYYSIREYPIKFLLDVVPIADQYVGPHFFEIEKATFWNRVTYVLTHAVLVPMSLANFVLLIGFTVCCLITVPYSSEFSQYVGSWYVIWRVYYFVTVSVVFITNVGVVLLALIIVIVSVNFAMFCICILCACLCRTGKKV